MNLSSIRDNRMTKSTIHNHFPHRSISSWPCKPHSQTGGAGHCWRLCEKKKSCWIVLFFWIITIGLQLHIQMNYSAVDVVHFRMCNNLFIVHCASLVIGTLTFKIAPKWLLGFSKIFFSDSFAPSFFFPVDKFQRFKISCLLHKSKNFSVTSARLIPLQFSDLQIWMAEKKVSQNQRCIAKYV